MVMEGVIYIGALIMLIVSAILMFVSEHKVRGRFGVGNSAYAEFENYQQAHQMLVSATRDCTDGDKRKFRESRDAGCHVGIILQSPRDCTKLIELVHKTRGRLVLVKKADCDIDILQGNPEEFRKVVKRLDTARTRRLERRRRK